MSQFPRLLNSLILKDFQPLSAWSEENRILTPDTSALPGRWSNEVTPYLIEPMDAFTDDSITDIVIQASSQVAKTELEINSLLYMIDRDPVSCLWVLPSDDLCKDFSQLRLMPAIRACDITKKRLDEIAIDKKEQKVQTIKFTGGFVRIQGANSPSKLSSFPCKYVWMDEVSKFPAKTGKEAAPMQLADERTKTFGDSAKRIKTSTPIFDGDAITTEMKSCECERHYTIPCPHCGFSQELFFDIDSEKGGIKFPKQEDSEEFETYKLRAEKSAYYECKKCGGVIDDEAKIKALKLGKWESTRGTKKGAKKVGYFINSLYSPFVTFGAVVKKYLETKDDPTLEQNFVNSWLGLPYSPKKISDSSDDIKLLIRDIPDLVVPKNTVQLTMAIDVQKDHFYTSVRAWENDGSSTRIYHARVNSWTALEDILYMDYKTENGEIFKIRACAVDSGYHKDEVYNFVAINSHVAIPVKGSSHDMKSPYNLSNITDMPFQLLVVDTEYYKDIVDAKIQRSVKAAKENQPCEAGFWVSTGVDEDYCKQITSEYKVIEKAVRGKEKTYWDKKLTHGANHYWDCEVYHACLADYIGVRFLKRARPIETQPTNNTRETQTIYSDHRDYY